MARHSENDFVIPALKALYSLGGKATMSAIKDEIPKYIELSEEDMEPFISRRMKRESRYRQVIGNITSHHNDLFFAYAESIKEGPIYRFSLNEDGKKYVESLLLEEATSSKKDFLSGAEPREAEKIFLSEKPTSNISETYALENNQKEETLHTLQVSEPQSYKAEGSRTEESAKREQKGDEQNTDEIVVHEVFNTPGTPEITVTDIDKKVIAYAKNNGLAKRPAGDSKIRDTILEICQRKCQYALFTGKTHPTFLGNDGKPYVEAHHLIPMEARKDFFPKNLDRPSNIVCLCPTCHSLLHHGNKEQKEEILRVLYDNFKDQLNADGLYISFRKLLDQYY